MATEIKKHLKHECLTREAVLRFQEIRVRNRSAAAGKIREGHLCDTGKLIKEGAG